MTSEQTAFRAVPRARGAAEAAEAGDGLPEALGVPALTSPVIDGNNAYFHGRELDTGKVVERLAEEPKVRIVHLYADTVTLSASPAVELKESIGWQITARRVVVAKGAELRMANGSGLVLYTSEITDGKQAGKLPLKVPASGGGWRDRPVALEKRAGLQVRVADDEAAVTEQKTVPLPEGEPVQLARSLTMLFQHATQFWAADRARAVAMLRWTSRLAAQSTHLRELFAQASSLLQLHDNDLPHGRYVPALNRDLYGKHLGVYQKAVAAYEADYVALRNRQLSIDDRVKAAEALLADMKDTHSFHTHLRQQAKFNADGAAAALDRAKKDLQHQKNEVDRAERDFEAQIEYLKKKGILDAVVNGSLALISLGTAIASGAMGVFQAGPAIEKLVKTIELAQEIIKQAADIARTVKAVQDALELVDELRGLNGEMQEMVRDLDAASMKKIEELLRKTAGHGSVNAIAEWENFQVIARAMLGSFAEGASYLAALEGLSVYGRAFVTAQAGYLQASQQLIRTTLQAELSRRQCLRMQAHIGELKQTKTLSDGAAQAFYQGYLDQKRWMFIALENYGRAYRYWALAEPRTVPTMAADAAGLAGRLADIAREYEAALEGFDPPPQPRTASWKVTEKKALQGLDSQEGIDLPIDLRHPEFHGLDRVRLNTVRVYLDGAVPAAGKSIVIGVHGSGGYQDRFRGTEFAFSSRPSHRTFEYKLVGGRPEIVTDGKVSEEFGKVLMQPTPFTGWRFTVLKKNNPGLDLSKVTSVTVEMIGDMIRPEAY
ncbi:hypothetical protein [Nocardiopsis potens]|uniref:hypothetical protein n=1 Tax=Nocardiopsis potens TaxID=1246458 RepID=UPI00034CA12F|nr:hypothetical protein [Nocardiopsis potens]